MIYLEYTTSYLICIVTKYYLAYLLYKSHSIEYQKYHFHVKSSKHFFYPAHPNTDNLTYLQYISQKTDISAGLPLYSLFLFNFTFLCSPSFRFLVMPDSFCQLSVIDFSIQLFFQTSQDTPALSVKIYSI